MIWTEERNAVAISPGIFNADSLRHLAGNGTYNREFVDGVPLVGVAQTSGAYHLSSAIYTHLASNDLQRLQGWEKACLCNDECVFGVYAGNSWTAVRVHWKRHTMEHYDPSCGLPGKGLSGAAKKISNVGDSAQVDELAKLTIVTASKGMH